MAKTITLPDPPSSWNELTKEQLIFIHSLPRGEMSDSIFKMQVFLHLCGLELCGESFYAEPGSTEQEQTGEIKDGVADSDTMQEDSGEDVTLDDINSRLSWMESVLSGTADITVVLRKSHEDGEQEQEDEPLMCIAAEDLFNAITHYTEFLDDPYHLDDCKIGEIRIGDRMYEAPAPQMISLTYEQYQDANSYMGAIWSLSQEIDGVHKQMMSLVAKAQKRSKDGSLPEDVVPAEMLKAVEELTSELKESQACFLSRVLIPMDVKTEELSVLDDSGKPVLDKKGKPVKKTITYNEARTFSSSDADRCVPDIKEHAPQWLFPLMYQWFQSALAAQQKNFPKLFSGKKGGGESNPLVATVSTLNTLMKEQGYADQQAVLDANAIFNFQKLDALTRQAEEMERMNKKMKSKHK